MKHLLYTLIGAATLLTANNNTALAQAKVKPATILPMQTSALHAASMQSYKAFKQSVKPLIASMGSKQIIGLGEGTHGTAEFYKVRYWISRILIEEKGFTHIAFENDYSDSWLLNRQLNSNANLDSLMQKHLLKIWQNQETKELLNWVKSYNRTHSRKVIIDGIDYVYARPDVELLKQQLTGTQASHLLDSVGVIAQAAAYQDEAWEGMNQKSYKVNMDSLAKSSCNGYMAAAQLAEHIRKADLPAQIKANCYLAVQNVKQAFSPFYAMMSKKEEAEATRDSVMCYNTAMLMKTPGTKIIIWAHNAHMAKTGIYNNAAGGAGGHIARMFPGQYFVLGTGTATGTFAATTEPRDTYSNAMNAYLLDTPLKDSWEEWLTNTGKPAFYFNPAKLNLANESRGLRFIGYSPKSGASTYDNTSINSHFDAFLFIKNTHAATPLK
jgi:erythromycin esterase